MKLPTIAEGFRAYRALVIPDDAGPVQVLETEAAFYGAVYWMLQSFLNSMDDDVDEDDGARGLERLKQESERFLLQRGREEKKKKAAPPEFPTVADQSSYNVRHTEVEQLLRKLGRDLKGQMPPGFGYTLLIFSYGKLGLTGEGKEGSMFYISTAERHDMVQAMKEFIARNTQ